jgi:glycerophosphoryl diester phosphodiesterase
MSGPHVICPKYVFCLQQRVVILDHCRHHTKEDRVKTQRLFSPRKAVVATLVALASAAASMSALAASFPTLDGKPPLVVGHRGAPGYVPEHTLESYRLAIAMGADVIEPDLVSTKDGALIARHEPMLGGTTNVASIAKFASRKRTMNVDGYDYSDWFAIDFTLAEIKELRARERVAGRNTTFDGAFEIVTLQDVIDLAKKETIRTGRTIHIYPETKHPTWHAQQGLPLEQKLVDTLNAAGWTRKTDPVFIQSFEVGNLKKLRTMTGLRLVQLMGCYDNDLATGKCMYLPKDPDSAPWDFIVANDNRTYADLSTPAGLAEVKSYADGIGPWKRQFIGVKAVSLGADGKPQDVNGNGTVNENDGVSVKNSNLIAYAKAAGLFIHPYTARSDVSFARDYAGGGTGQPGVRDVAAAFAEYQQMLALGLDGMFSDHSNDLYAARAMFAADQTYVVELAASASSGVQRHFRVGATDAAVSALANLRSTPLLRTNDVFKAWTVKPATPNTLAVCRYFDAANARHVYSIESTRCASFASAGYANEGTAFYAAPADSQGACPAGTAPVFRYERSVSGVTFERYSQTGGTSFADYTKVMMPAFCAPN